MKWHSWTLAILSLAALAAPASSQGAQGCALGRGGGVDGVEDGCFGDVAVDYEVDSPLHATGRVRFTDSTGSSGWVAATPHHTAGCTDSQTATTSDGGSPPAEGGTYRIRAGKVEKRNARGDWIEQARRVKPDGDEVLAFRAAALAAGGVIPWQTYSVVPSSASYDGASFEPLRSTPGGQLEGRPFALGWSSSAGLCFLAPGSSCDGLLVVVVGAGEGSGTLPARADAPTPTVAAAFWEWLQ